MKGRELWREMVVSIRCSQSFEEVLEVNFFLAELKPHQGCHMIPARDPLFVRYPLGMFINLDYDYGHVAG